MAEVVRCSAEQLKGRQSLNSRPPYPNCRGHTLFLAAKGGFDLKDRRCMLLRAVVRPQ